MCICDSISVIFFLKFITLTISIISIISFITISITLITYVSAMNGSKSTIDHFIISNSLLNYVNHSDVRDDVDNHSDHLPITLYMYIYVPIAKIAASNIWQYLPKPKWFCVDKEMLHKYQYELD